MALSDLAVFSEYVYESSTEVLSQQVELFNAATEGAIVLVAAAHMGDFADAATWAKISGLVRRRNAYGTGAVGEKSLTMLVDTMVKVAAGTPPVRIDPGMFNWIQAAPTEAGTIIGQQLAGDMLADMLNTALIATKSALAGVPGGAASLDHGATVGGHKLTYNDFNDAQALFGDRFSDILVWVMRSQPLFDLWGQNLTNDNGLFNGGGASNIAVRRDPFGRLMVISDSPALANAADGTHPVTNSIMGLTAGAVRVEKNNDFDANVSTVNGQENIVRTYQAEWSYELGVKGFAWDKSTGGKSPTDAAIGAAGSWDKIATATRDLAGVLLRVQ